MNYDDLTFEPSRIGGGFFASCHFSDGSTAYIHTDDLTPGADEYRLTLTSSLGRLLYQQSHLDRIALVARLNRFAFFA